MVNLVGQQFGQYRLTRLLGRGRFADVYLGEQIYLASQAAIKVLSAPLASEAHSGFLDEARTLVSLAHPRIIRLLDYGGQEQTPFLVMEYAPSGARWHAAKAPSRRRTALTSYRRGVCAAGSRGVAVRARQTADPS